jgi:hypothetical protein
MTTFKTESEAYLFFFHMVTNAEHLARRLSDYRININEYDQDLYASLAVQFAKQMNLITILEDND